MYVQSNMHMGGNSDAADLKEVEKLVKGIRNWRLRLCSFEAGVLPASSRLWVGNLSSTTLMLFGAKGTGTGVHMDRAAAINVLIDIKESPLRANTVYARWTFFHPRLVPRLAAWMQRHPSELWPEGLCSRPAPRLAEADVTAFKRSLSPEEARLVVTVSQTAEKRVMRVPTGWPHMVENVEACAKMAWDILISSSARQHVETARLFSTYFRQGLSKDADTGDYVALLPSVFAAVLAVRNEARNAGSAAAGRHSVDVSAKRSAAGALGGARKRTAAGAACGASTTASERAPLAQLNS